ncbi:MULTISPECIES: hypothetical protein [unclassified Streptomyces]|uniref:hypothetical protein n=1 Tax=unclassified Streptomyces TaxID=2593676 RepID=UPI00331F85CB
MTDMEQALTISGGIFAVMMLTQYGRRKYDLHKVLMPIGTVSAVGYFYLKGMPAHHADVVVYLVGAAIGLACGLVATLTTGVERDPGTGKVHTRCGAGFVAIWTAVVALRVAFIFLAEHNTWFRDHLGTFMLDHHIAQDAVAPFFVIMALAMVLTRVFLLLARVRLPAPAGTLTRGSSPVRG